VTVNPSDLLNIEQTKLETFDAWVTQNSRHQLYFNPLALATFDKTVVTPTEAVGFKILSEKEVALFFVQPGSENSVPFKRSKNKRTGTCSFSPIVARRPYLRVPKGRQMRYPFRLDTPTNGTPVFVLIVANAKPALPQNNGRKNTSRKKKQAQPAETQAPSVMPDTPETDA
jgi:hypothetical protein